MTAFLGRAAYLTLPSVFCLAVYWPGLWVWFQQDDFAWLGLHLSIHSRQDIWGILFSPMAQGTIRPWSERVFFLAFYGLFGLDAFPFRLCVFLTQFANLALLASVTRRLTGSRHAAFWAPVFWTANTALATPMTWTSSYNQILCGFFVLLAFYLLLRHVETGRHSFWVWQGIVFLLGFGALEMNVVYPALAASYALCCARPFLFKTLPLFVPSAAYTLLHRAASPRAAEGPYAMHFDASMPATLWRYWTWAMGGIRLQNITADPVWITVGLAATSLVGLALLVFVVWKLSRKQWLAGFPLLWFLILLAPVLPLRDHVSDYYLTLPTIGLAVLGAWAFATSFKAALHWKLVGVLLASLYLGTSIPVSRAIVLWNYERSQAVRNLVLGVERAHQIHPEKVILLSGVGTDLFWSGVADKPFRLFGMTDVYLVPGSEGNIQVHPELGQVSDYVLPPGPTLRLLANGEAVVYAAGGERLRNVTASYQLHAPELLKPELARRVDVGKPYFADQLGPGWHAAEGGYRWMAKRASVRLGRARSPAERLYLTGYCTATQLKSGPVRMTVSVDGELLPAVLLTRPDAQFDFEFSLPMGSFGKESVEVVVEVERTFVAPQDGRELGAAFGVLEIR